MTINYKTLLQDPSFNPYNIIDMFDRGLNPAQCNLVRLAKSNPTIPINKAVESLVHVVLGNYTGSESDDCIEAREELPNREETIAFLHQILDELI